jgi:hypothetical protein
VSRGLCLVLVSVCVCVCVIVCEMEMLQVVKARRAPRDCFQSRLGTLACEIEGANSHHLPRGPGIENEGFC